jgi:uncharacterized protein YndB with AHSA1/START domain
VPHIIKSGRYDAPIERVFALATDFERYPEWNVNYAEIKDVSGPVVVGTRVTGIMRFMGRQVEGTGEIIEVDPPHLIRMSGTRPEGGHMDMTYRFTPAEPGTEYEFEIDYELPPGIIGQIADRLFVERAVDRDLRHTIENFEALLVAEAPLPVGA